MLSTVGTEEGPRILYFIIQTATICRIHWQPPVRALIDLTPRKVLGQEAKRTFKASLRKHPLIALTVEEAPRRGSNFSLPGSRTL
jgi:hypothetical protein